MFPKLSENGKKWIYFFSTRDIFTDFVLGL